MRRILVIDDDPKEIVVTRNTAWRAGLFPDCVATGEEAISHLLKTAYTYIVMEPSVKGLNLPLIVSLANKHQGRNAGIVVITKDPSLTSERRLREMGVLYYMVKPINPVELALVLTGPKEVHRGQAGQEET